jgi:hypothetical protein
MVRVCVLAAAYLPFKMVRVKSEAFLKIPHEIFYYIRRQLLLKSCEGNSCQIITALSSKIIITALVSMEK